MELAKCYIWGKAAERTLCGLPDPELSLACCIPDTWHIRLAPNYPPTMLALTIVASCFMQLSVLQASVTGWMALWHGATTKALLLAPIWIRWPIKRSFAALLAPLPTRLAAQLQRSGGSASIIRC